MRRLQLGTRSECGNHIQCTELLLQMRQSSCDHGDRRKIIVQLVRSLYWPFWLCTDLCFAAYNSIRPLGQGNRLFQGGYQTTSSWVCTSLRVRMTANIDLVIDVPLVHNAQVKCSVSNDYSLRRYIPTPCNTATRHLFQNLGPFVLVSCPYLSLIFLLICLVKVISVPVFNHSRSHLTRLSSSRT